MEAIAQKTDKKAAANEVIDVDIRMDGNARKFYYDLSRKNARLLVRIADAIACKDRMERETEPT